MGWALKKILTHQFPSNFCKDFLLTLPKSYHAKYYYSSYDLFDLLFLVKNSEMKLPPRAQFETGFLKWPVRLLHLHSGFADETRQNAWTLSLYDRRYYTYDVGAIIKFDGIETL